MTVNLDADVYSFTSAYAGARGITLSAAIGELVRRAESVVETGSESARLKASPHGYLVIAGTGNVLTPEMVKETQRMTLPEVRRFLLDVNVFLALVSKTISTISLLPSG